MGFNLVIEKIQKNNLVGIFNKHRYLGKSSPFDIVTRTNEGEHSFYNRFFEQIVDKYSIVSIEHDWELYNLRFPVRLKMPPPVEHILKVVIDRLSEGHNTYITQHDNLYEEYMPEIVDYSGEFYIRSRKDLSMYADWMADYDMTDNVFWSWTTEGIVTDLSNDEFREWNKVSVYTDDLATIYLEGISILFWLSHETDFMHLLLRNADVDKTISKIKNTTSVIDDIWKNIPAKQETQ